MIPIFASLNPGYSARTSTFLIPFAAISRASAVTSAQRSRSASAR
jgi:hypothetical protein